jgi:hypothetical protein
MTKRRKYEIDLANDKSDEIVATLVIDDVPATTTEGALQRHYQQHVNLFMRQFHAPRVVAVRRLD